MNLSIPNGVPNANSYGYLCQRCKAVFYSQTPFLVCPDCSGKRKVDEAQRTVDEASLKLQKAEKKLRKAKKRAEAARESYWAAHSRLQEARRNRW